MAKPKTLTTEIKPLETKPSLPQMVKCEACAYRVEKQCRLNPPAVVGSFAVYPTVVTTYNENHGCFQGLGVK